MDPGQTVGLNAQVRDDRADFDADEASQKRGHAQYMYIYAGPVLITWGMNVCLSLFFTEMEANQTSALPHPLPPVAPTSTSAEVVPTRVFSAKRSGSSRKPLNVRA